MFLLDDGTVVTSASDLAAAAACEFAVLRTLDAKLGRIAAPTPTPDAMTERAARLGDRHEERVLARLVERFGPWDPERGRGVAQIERPPTGRHTDRAVLEATHAHTLQVLRTGADVVFQAGFFDGRFGGWADFLIRETSPAHGTALAVSLGWGVADEGAVTAPAARVGDGARDGDDADGVYAVYDTKLARHARPTALVQLAAYGDQLLRAGVPTARTVHLLLGDRTRTDHRLLDLVPVYLDRRAHLERLVDERRAADAPLQWGEGPVRACGRCDICAPEVAARRDLILVAGMRTTQRARLHAAGVVTVDDLAALDHPVEGIGSAALATLRSQARLQAEQDPPGGAPASSDGAPTSPDGASGSGGPLGWSGGVRYELVAPEAVTCLPSPDRGDVFFDFEGDPLWVEGGSTDWGLEYLFGVVEAPVDGAAPVFRAFWAHDRAQEKQALLEFLAYIEARRRRFPGMHVYHYAPYERTALLRLAGRHGVGEEAVDALLREGVLVDLYATVRAALRTGQRSYSLKKLEPLYMDGARAGEVTTAGDSIVEYAEACALRDDGDLVGWKERLDAIADYNAYDCLSTLRLRDWLRAAADEELARRVTSPSEATTPDVSAREVTAPDATAGSTPPEAAAPVGAAPEDDPLVEALLAVADGAGGRSGRSADQQAVALLAASLGYHWRETKPFWWAHFDRLTSDPAEWTERRSTFLVDEAEVVQPWHVPTGRSRAPRRRLRLVGRLEPGSELRTGATACALYDEPVPPCARTTERGRRGWTEGITVLDVQAEGVGTATRDVLFVEEALRVADTPHDALPMGLGPARPPRTDGLAAAVREVAEEVAAAVAGIRRSAAQPGAGEGHPNRRGTAADAPRADAGRDAGDPALAAALASALPQQPALDLMRRLPPRLRRGGPLPHPDDPSAGTIVAALLDLDRSYLAVQGPPGTGKTHTGATVIRTLVDRGWRVGVVAQSHAVVEHMLAAIGHAGVPAPAIGKKPNGQADPGAGWTWLSTEADFRRFHARQQGGYVLGGTVWDFTNPRRIPAEPFDLLVVDEAGQFALANTIAVSRAAHRLLLLGDPQQLPQVSQGRHPEPVDRSALGWLADGHDTLPAHLGYFLAQTWRMHPQLCAAVSDLAYEGRLTSRPCTAQRSLEGVPPGVRTVLLDHAGNAVASTEEADEVVRQIRDLVGRRWVDPAADVDRPLTATDVIVVAAYNAQVWTVRRALDAAGLAGVEVGTVDLFQGRQAPVVILTTAASSPEDVPRGMEFLLDRNRINVAVSRGQWCAVVVRARGLTDYLPNRPELLEELGAFIGLCGGPSSAGTPDGAA